MDALQSVLKVPFEDELYEQGEGPEFSREAWLKVKPSMDLPYSNLPYYIDGSVKLVRSRILMALFLTFLLLHFAYHCCLFIVLQTLQGAYQPVPSLPRITR